MWLKLFVLMFIQFGMITLNTTAIAHKMYLATAITDTIICILGFTILKDVQQSGSKSDMAGYTAGGVLGAQFAIFMGTFLK